MQLYGVKDVYKMCHNVWQNANPFVNRTVLIGRRAQRIHIPRTRHTNKKKNTHTPFDLQRIYSSRNIWPAPNMTITGTLHLCGFYFIKYCLIDKIILSEAGESNKENPPTPVRSWNPSLRNVEFIRSTRRFWSSYCSLS